MIPNVGNIVENLHSSLLLAGANNSTILQEHFAKFYQNFNHNDSGIQLLSTYSKELKIGTQILVHKYSQQYYSQHSKDENNLVSVNRWLDKQIVVYTYDGKLFSHKNEWSMCGTC